MNDVSRWIIKHIAENILKNTNNKILLGAKDVSDIVEKLSLSCGKDDVITDETPLVTENSENKHLDSSHSNNNGGIRENYSGLKNTKNYLKRGDANRLWNKRISEDSVNARTIMILKSITAVKMQESLPKRLEHLIDHLKMYPDAVYYANKTGVGTVLLNLKKSQKDTVIKQILNEILSLMGYNEPPALSGIRVLSIDGGGMRGLVTIKILQELENISGKRIHELFDYICGVSTGAVITCCSVPPITLDLGKLRDLYIELGREIFKQSALKGAGKLIFNCAYYETSVWEKVLKNYVGSTTLLETTRSNQCPKFSVVSTVGDAYNVVPFLFRNYSLLRHDKNDYPGSCVHSMFEALRASGAAPTVFEEFRTDKYSHIDGGLVANNPAGVAIHEIKALWPQEKLKCFVSCGNGKQRIRPDKSNTTSSWKRILDNILDSATDTESVHMILKDLLDENVYYRFNPTLTTSFALDEVSEKKILLLEEDAIRYCKNNKAKLTAAAVKLTEASTQLNKSDSRQEIKITNDTE